MRYILALLLCLVLVTPAEASPRLSRADAERANLRAMEDVLWVYNAKWVEVGNCRRVSRIRFGCVIHFYDDFDRRRDVSVAVWLQDNKVRYTWRWSSGIRAYHRRVQP